jgi:hypothetical protein
LPVCLLDRHEPFDTYADQADASTLQVQAGEQRSGLGVDLAGQIGVVTQGP